MREWVIRHAVEAASVGLHELVHDEVDDDARDLATALYGTPTFPLVTEDDAAALIAAILRVAQRPQDWERLAPQAAGELANIIDPIFQELTRGAVRALSFAAARLAHECGPDAALRMLDDLRTSVDRGDV